ncbi:aaa family protein [Cystoisospora suis]|uniref:Aaa family protein n=1 Tax=Cystoisospora suis TaxID=483139 RepID=A0A2C6LD26_9APIC|nr:aaa family protein [Cystoisospora suis]
MEAGERVAISIPIEASFSEWKNPPLFTANALCASAATLSTLGAVSGSLRLLVLSIPPSPVEPSQSSTQGSSSNRKGEDGGVSHVSRSSSSLSCSSFSSAPPPAAVVILRNAEEDLSPPVKLPLNKFLVTRDVLYSLRLLSLSSSSSSSCSSFPSDTRLQVSLSPLRQSIPLSSCVTVCLAAAPGDPSFAVSSSPCPSSLLASPPAAWWEELLLASAASQAEASRGAGKIGATETVRKEEESVRGQKGERGKANGEQIDGGGSGGKKKARSNRHKKTSTASPLCSPFPSSSSSCPSASTSSSHPSSSPLPTRPFFVSPKASAGLLRYLHIALNGACLVDGQFRSLTLQGHPVLVQIFCSDSSSSSSSRQGKDTGEADAKEGPRVMLSSTRTPLVRYSRITSSSRLYFTLQPSCPPGAQEEAPRSSQGEQSNLRGSPLSLPSSERPHGGRPKGLRSLGGLHRVLPDLVWSLILPLLRPDLFQAYGVHTPKGMLLYGPPGSGKTHLARSIADELLILCEKANRRVSCGGETTEEDNGTAEGKKNGSGSLSSFLLSLLTIPSRSSTSSSLRSSPDFSPSSLPSSPVIVAPHLELVNATDLISPIIGQTEKNIHRLFERCREEQRRRIREARREAKATLMRNLQQNRPFLKEDEGGGKGIKREVKGNFSLDLKDAPCRKGSQASSSPSSCPGVSTTADCVPDINSEVDGKVLKASIAPCVSFATEGEEKHYVQPRKTLTEEEVKKAEDAPGVDCEYLPPESVRVDVVGGGTLLFIDEIDAICPRREDATEVGRRAVCALLSCLDGVATDGSLFVLAATNHPHSLDEAIRRAGRLERDIEVGVPTAEERREILEKLLEAVPHDLTKEEIDELSELCQAFVPADLRLLVTTAGTEAMKASVLSSVKSDPLGSLDDARRRNQRQVDFRKEEESALVKKTEAVTLRHFRMALRLVKPSALKALAIEVPHVRWDDIGGYQKVKKSLQECVEWPLKFASLFKQLKVSPPRGVLLYGPPGCSKTMMAKAVATESKMNFISVKGPELFSKWVGESERAVRDIFRKARQNAPCVIFFDEVDAMGGDRETGEAGGVDSRVLSQMLNEMDGIGPVREVVIIAATNRPDLLDAALLRPGRFDRLVYVPLPDWEARRDIALKMLRSIPLRLSDAFLQRERRHRQGSLACERGEEKENVCPGTSQELETRPSDKTYAGELQRGVTNPEKKTQEESVCNGNTSPKRKSEKRYDCEGGWTVTEETSSLTDGQCAPESDGDEERTTACVRSLANGNKTEGVSWDTERGRKGLAPRLSEETGISQDDHNKHSNTMEAGRASAAKSENESVAWCASWLANQTDGYSGAEIVMLCREACMAAVRDVVNRYTEALSGRKMFSVVDGQDDWVPRPDDGLTERRTTGEAPSHSQKTDDSEEVYVDEGHLRAALRRVQPRTPESLLEFYESYNSSRSCGFEVA